MKISVIIPTYNEAAAIGPLLQYLQRHMSPDTELIVADGGSDDGTRAISDQQGAQVIHCGQRGRGPQMNAGARASTGDLLYFLHADTFPPEAFEAHLRQAVQQGAGSGCYRLRFDLPHWFLHLNAWFTRFNVDALRFGDQSLFVRRDIFLSEGGFDERMQLLEDQEVIGRLRRRAPFVVLPQQVTTSARKYKAIGVYRLQAGYYFIYGLYRMGVPQERLVQVYKWVLRP
ncbi:TIGR04283 family arsenosugar biosynthesis glycosyltransferase [Pontibacter saemangeumensis]|uniref:TIGR04283 family arsenosugar biosynthesis glycosyltransferase n=1 Tax=Pontibacter saemangeumensis TaxID=1084525 RepID=A0ABP8M120_9BACT